jgi:tetratricopeptide (TPR) repeat protein
MVGCGAWLSRQFFAEVRLALLAASDRLFSDKGPRLPLPHLAIGFEAFVEPRDVRRDGNGFQRCRRCRFSGLPGESGREKSVPGLSLSAMIEDSAQEGRTRQVARCKRNPSRGFSIMLRQLPRGGLWRFCAFLLTCSSALVLVSLGARRCDAQLNPQSRAVPRADYFLSFAAYYDGDFIAARKNFQSAAKGGIRSTEGRWVDSICYHTMIGESYYQLGQRELALEQYTNALRLFSSQKNWLLRVDFPDSIDAASVPAMGNITWGRSTRKTIIGRFPDTMLSAQGRMDNDQVIRQGGVIAPPQYYPLRVNEIVRCTALAIARRNEIMGPVCEHDPFTMELVNTLASRPAPPNHWSQAWISVQLGMALASAGKKAEAAAELTKGLQVGATFDHPLTPLALLELGKLAFSEEKYDAAAVYFYEATFPAVAFEQYDVLEEAFRWGELTHVVSNKPGVYAPLVPAQQWARTKGPKTLQASLFILAAENLSNLGKVAEAGAMLEQAAKALNRRDMQGGQIGARFNYETARVAFSQNKLAAGNTALAACMAFQQGGSRRLYQISVADNLYVSGQIRVDRIAELLYDDVLREPTAADWLIDPMETMAVVTTPHVGPMEHWFEAAVKRKQVDKAAEIADRIRRHRFYSTTPMGGRILALRWILEAPEAVLSDAAKLQRADLLAKYPRLNALSKEAAAIKASLEALPRVPADANAAKTQSELFGKLATVSTAQELLLSDVALRREASEFVFPQLIEIKDLQQRLKPGQAILAYFTTARYVVGFAITNESCKMWQITPADTIQVKQDLAALFKAWGHHDKNGIVSGGDLAKDDWKPVANQLLSTLTNGAKAEHFDSLQELIIVPDGLVWYIPFEALQVNRDGEFSPLLSKLKVRYAPTLGLALPDGRTMPRDARTAIVAGKMYPKEDEATATEEANELSKVVPGSFVVPKDPTAPGSLFASIIDRLVVLDDVEDAERGPYEWAPFRRDKDKPAGALSNWALLPWAGPQQVVIPGFHTPVEFGLKRGGSGDEVFLSVMGLMASGSRTVMLSRWRTGGQTSYDLIREFVQELPHTSPASAWQRSVQLVTATPLDTGREPRLRATAEDGVKANHPFFWAGYLLVDTGGED